MKRKKIWQIGYPILLGAFTAYVLLDAFLIPRTYAEVTSPQSPQETLQADDTPVKETVEPDVSPIITENSYQDDRISITITSYRAYDTDIYVADILLSDADALRTAFAKDIFGKNITQTTSAIAASHDAILAINGDYYGVRDGYVIRNGELFRTSSNGEDQQDLVIDSDGAFHIVQEDAESAEELLQSGGEQVLSFGPGLVEEGQILVDTGSEVSKATVSNPRTAIGCYEPLHYVFVVSDGRTEQSAGLSLYELAEFMQSLGVKTVYNLDGGGSSTMVFCGNVVNQPTSGKGIKEREVSDIVYIG